MIPSVTRVCVRHLQLLDDVLDMEKVDSGTLAFAPRPCIVVDVMERSARDLRSAAHVRGIELAFRAFGSSAEALTALYSGAAWAVVQPHVLPHEGVRDVSSYLGAVATLATVESNDIDNETQPRSASSLRRRRPGAAQFEFSLASPTERGPAHALSRSGCLYPDDACRRADFGPCGAVVSVDAARLQQVFYNIVMNAIRASASGSAVLAFAYVVRSGPSDVQFCFGVQDNGHGMDAERASAIGIEPLQASLLSATSSYHGRAGLGLSFAKVIVTVRVCMRLSVILFYSRCWIHLTHATSRAGAARLVSAGALTPRHRNHIRDGGSTSARRSSGGCGRVELWRSLTPCGRGPPCGVCSAGGAGSGHACACSSSGG